MDNLAAAFNAWMDEFTKSPESFEATELSAMQYLRDRLDGREPTYGECCAETLKRYLQKVDSTSQ